MGSKGGLIRSSHMKNNKPIEIVIANIYIRLYSFVQVASMGFLLQAKPQDVHVFHQNIYKMN